jgi:hypothetical protein
MCGHSYGLADMSGFMQALYLAAKTHTPKPHASTLAPVRDE